MIPFFFLWQGGTYQSAPRASPVLCDSREHAAPFSNVLSLFLSTAQRNVNPPDVGSLDRQAIAAIQLENLPAP